MCRVCDWFVVFVVALWVGGSCGLGGCVYRCLLFRFELFWVGFGFGFVCVGFLWLILVSDLLVGLYFDLLWVVFL